MNITVAQEENRNRGREDRRYAYGSTCTWHGPIQEVGSKEFDIEVGGKSHHIKMPACPHCQGPLLEFKSREEWAGMLAAFQDEHPEMPLYQGWIESLREEPSCRNVHHWDWREHYRVYERCMRMIQ